MQTAHYIAEHHRGHDSQTLQGIKGEVLEYEFVSHERGKEKGAGRKIKY